MNRGVHIEPSKKQKTPLLMKLKVFISAYLFLILVMFLLPFFTEQGYSIIRNTTSQLGAQHTQNAWLMNFTFALMGLSSIYAGWTHYHEYWMHKILLLSFGLSLVLTAIYSHAPINALVSYSIREDELHSLFASTTGFSFTLLAIATGFIKQGTKNKLLPIAIGIIATLLSMMMFTIENYMGIWQRMIFIVSFGWLIYEFKDKAKLSL
jgi:hypothetical protein